MAPSPNEADQKLSRSALIGPRAGVYALAAGAISI